MSDDKSKRGQADRSKINIHEDYELQYWSEKYGVTGDQLREVVGKVGTSPEAVAAALNNS